MLILLPLSQPTKMKREIVQIHQIRVGPSWVDFIVLFLKDDILLEERAEANKV